MYSCLLLAALIFNLSGMALAGDEGYASLKVRDGANRIAYIPPQCFTKVSDEKKIPQHGKAENPCYVCHAETREPNYLSQPELQVSYAFPAVRAGHGAINPWTNVLRDTRIAQAAISDADIARYVHQDNYLDDEGRIAINARLDRLPANWDTDGNGRWDGYRPDAYFHFDKDGYDRDPYGRDTGWRAFVYYPFPGAFMPTNGAFDDVLIRLPAAFRETEDGNYDRKIYATNLAIVEALIKRSDIAMAPVNEKTLGVDLDKDGKLAMADRVRYDWAPVEKRFMSYVGRARILQAEGKLHLAAGLFPEGTEFLHSVRYLEPKADGSVTPAPRMKELRYARKSYWMSYGDLKNQAIIEAKDEALNPDRPEMFGDNPERGLNTKTGWTYQGFIEDKTGNLRPQNYEETLFCMGCHAALSATEDSSFAFPRKRNSGDAHGWQHWSDWKKPLADPLRDDGKPEYATYLMNNHAGDEFRANMEVKAKFFTAEGEPKAQAFERLAKDIAFLMIPSVERARALNKAYKVIVDEQSYVRGRDAILKPADHVWAEVDPEDATGIMVPEPAPRLKNP